MKVVFRNYKTCETSRTPQMVVGLYAVPSSSTRYIVVKCYNLYCARRGWRLANLAQHFHAYGFFHCTHRYNAAPDWWHGQNRIAWT